MGLRTLIARMAGLFSFRGNRPSQPRENRAPGIPVQQLKPPMREQRDSQPFPIKHAARRQAVHEAFYGVAQPLDSTSIDERARKLETAMRDAWETRVDDGILARAGNK